MIGQELHEKTFLDAFGGSGIMGFEAFSRGATTTIYEKKYAVFRSIQVLIQQESVEIVVKIKFLPKEFFDVVNNIVARHLAVEPFSLPELDAGRQQRRDSELRRATDAKLARPLDATERREYVIGRLVGVAVLTAREDGKE